MMQNMVADAVSLGIANLYDYRETARANGDEIDYKICLQVHDAVSSFVRYDHVERYIEEVLPACLVQGVPIFPCHLDGLPMGTGPYHLGLDSEVFYHWGVTPLPDQLLADGINPKYAHWQPGSAYVNRQVVTGLVQEEAYPNKIWGNGQLLPIDKNIIRVVE
jgi:hypothetical protein